MTATPESMGKSDAATVVAANGPDDAILVWRAVDWRAVEGNVRRLRQRIFTPSQAGDLKKVRNLQKLMLRSRANTLVSVRRVTERNAGHKTGGVDGQVVLSPEAKMELAEWVQRYRAPVPPAIVIDWINHGFGVLSEQRLALLAATLIIVGIQIFFSSFSSFLLSILGLRRRR